MRMRLMTIATLIVATVTGCASGYRTGSSPRDHQEIVRPKGPVHRETQQQPPRLDPGEPERSARDLIAWASSSGAGEREAVRKAIQEVSGSEAVLGALCREAFGQRSKDHSRTLIVLAIIGETKSAAGERCLTEFVNLPFPVSGHDVQGEILEQTALGTLQAKAVDGLAYRMTATGDQTVLRLIREHPSRIVRAEAISAYLWNRGDSAEAKAQLAGVVRPDEKIFLDRVRRVPGDTAATFNPKLKAYLDSHPEVHPPAPVKGEGRRPVVCPANCVPRPADHAVPSSREKGQ